MPNSILLSKIDRNKLVVTQANKLAEASYTMTLEEKRIVLLLLSLVRREDKDFKTYRIPITDIRDYLRAQAPVGLVLIDPHGDLADVRAKAAHWCPSLAAKQFMLLRHTAVVRLAEAGCTAEEISAITGHSLATVDDILERYLVRTRKMAATAFKKRLANENETAQKV